MKKESLAAYSRGLRDGLPIGLGYLAVSFSLGITARGAGLNAVQGFLASLFTIASAGEYAAFTVIAADAAYVEIALIILVANCRYLLMSCALSQRVRPGTAGIHRVGIGAFVTDEIFGVSIAQEGWLKPAYTYGVASTAVLPWAIGTSLGVIAGNLLPARFVSALSVALYGMFIAVIIPPCRKKPVIAGLVLVSFLTSWIAGRLSFLSSISEGVRIIILTILLAGAAALLFPVKEDENAA